MYSIRLQCLRQSSSLARIANPLPAAFLRGGTSKGVFINRQHLPAKQDDWASLFLRIMGSPDAEHGRQLNGMGGGVSSLSKIMIVGPPSSRAASAGIDAEYTFAQVGIRDSEVDYSGNCGNLSSMTGAFAVDEGICLPRISQSSSTGESLGTVRMWNTNTNKEVWTTFPVSHDSKPVLDIPQVAIAGVPGKASQILLDFVDPAGARTGKLLPTGNPVDSKTVSPEGKHLKYTFSLVDATNPTVFITSEDLFSSPYLPDESVYTRPGAEDLLANIERIRAAGAHAMGLDPSAQAQPKIAILGLPHHARRSPPPPLFPDDHHPVDIDVQAMSMGVLHRAIPMTVGLCLGVAAAIDGTVAHQLVRRARTLSSRLLDSEYTGRQNLIRIRHPSGVVDVGADFSPDGRVTSAKVVRTGRRLMQGAVWW